MGGFFIKKKFSKKLDLGYLVFIIEVDDEIPGN